jgi:hypothetical protein
MFHYYLNLSFLEIDYGISVEIFLIGWLDIYDNIVLDIIITYLIILTLPGTSGISLSSPPSTCNL